MYLLHFKDSLPGTTVSIVDTDDEKLDLMTRLATIANESAGSPFRIESSTDRCDVLSGADFVVTSPAIMREELWKRAQEPEFVEEIQLGGIEDETQQ